MAMTEDRAFAIKQQVQVLAQTQLVEVKFLEVRRSSDFTRFLLNGERSDVLSLTQIFSDAFPNEDIEIIGSEQAGLDYGLTMVITEKLEQQTSLSPERRAKLRTKAEREED